MTRRSRPLHTSRTRLRIASRRLRLIPVISAACILGACAAEGPPRPPRIQIPGKVNDIRVTQAGRTLRLSFTMPQRATDGRLLTKPVEIQIFRQISPPGQPYAVPFLAVHPWLDLKPAARTKFQHGSQIIYEDRLSPQQFDSELDNLFTFAVVTLTRSFRGRPRRSDVSNLARTELLNVSSPITGLRVVEAPHALKLRWSPPARGLSHKPLAPLSGYRVYRGLKQFARSPYASTRSPSYADNQFDFGTRYFYSIRALFAKNGYTAESDDSKPTEITPRNIYPPPPPNGLEAVYAMGAMHLIWNPSTAAGVAGYNVYREGNEPPKRLNSSLLRTPTFQDHTVIPGRRYTYWVTAVDVNGNESSRSTSVTVETR